MSEATIIIGCGIPSDPAGRHDLLIERGRIRAVGRRLAARGARVVRAGGLVACPGLIDTQFNGGFGISFSGATPAQALEVGRRLLSCGVTSYLPTLISLPRDVTLRGIEALVEAARHGGGARILGIHLEGPFLSVDRRGAHKTENLRLPALAEFRAWWRASGGLLRMITIAPELPGALAVIREASRRGVIVAAGHSTAKADVVARAVARVGLRHVTHVFNGMDPLHHRDETLLSAALTDDRLSCGFIYDRHHVRARAARLLLRAKPAGRVVLVSDATAAMGAPDGELRADGARYFVRGGRVTVKGSDTLAGSAASLLEGVRCLVEDGLASLEEAIDLASRHPAALLGVRKGALEAGRDADVVLLDRRLRVRMTFVGGELLYTGG
jgi:N-acetylglucosamine-6-phosphate deacetylase